MKNLPLLGLCLGLLIICATSSAQQVIPLNEPDHNKPRLFTNLPEKIAVNIASLHTLVDTEPGRNVTLTLGGTIESDFNGKVISKVDKYNNIRSVVIRSSNFNGATFTLSSSIRSNGTVKFTGRILSLQHGDLYELKIENEQYVLVKKNFYDLINE